jgi:transposase
MAKPYSNDLRERVVAAIEAGHTRKEVADLYDLALGSSSVSAKQAVSARPNSAATGHLPLLHMPSWSRRSQLNSSWRS